MKLSKKLVSLFLTVAFVLGISITAFAAPNDDVIAALENAKVPATYIIQAENYLKTTTLTAAQSTAVIEQITIVEAIIADAGVKDLSLLSTADKNRIIAAVITAGKAIGLTITVTKQSDGRFLIVAKDLDGNVVVSFTSNEVTQTGFNSTIIYVGALMLLLAAGSVFVLRRKHLSVNA